MIAAYLRLTCVILVLTVMAGGGASHAEQLRQPQPRTLRVNGRNLVTQAPSSYSWTIGNDLVTLTVAIAPDGTLRPMALASASTGDVPLQPGHDTFTTVNDEALPLGLHAAGFAFEADAARDLGNGIELLLTFRLDKAGVSVIRHYAVYSGSPVVEIWTTVQALRAETQTPLSNLNTYDLALPAGNVNWLTGLQAAASEGGSFTQRRTDLRVGDELRFGSERRSSEAAVPWWTVDTGTTQFFGGLIWSGAWSAVFAREEVTLHLTLGSPGTATVVRMDDPVEMPHGFLGVTSGGAAAVTSAMRAFAQAGLRHGRPFPAPVAYNTWFVHGTRLEEEQVRDEMTHLARLGIDVYVLDAGWYLGSGAGDIFDFETGLGSWAVDTSRFPEGLASLREHAHFLGMSFGLWVEPGRTALNWINEPGLAREEWLVQSHGRYDPEVRNEAAKVGQLCLADPHVRAWLVQRLVELVESVRPDYLKWDDNRWIDCDRTGHTHGAGDGNFRQVQGLYSVLATLRELYPNMLIENVSGGGNRLDFGMLRFSDVGWMDDRSAPSLHVRHNLEGLATVFPPAYLLSFVMGDSSEPVVHSHDWSMLARSRMPGVMGLALRARELTDQDVERLAGEIQTYKRLRTILRDGSATLLSVQAPQRDSMDWDALQILSATTGDAVVFAFSSPQASERMVVRPRGLNPGGSYRIESADFGNLGLATGADLMIGGIELNASASAAHVLLLIRQVGQFAAGR